MNQAYNEQMDNQVKKDKQKPDLKDKLKKLMLFSFVIVIALYLLKILFPAQSEMSFEVMGQYGFEVLLILPPVLILMGLADVWVPKEKIKKYLGKESGFRGVLLSIFLGTLPTGPLFIAFPLAGEMLRKGARIANVVVFLGAWASLKMPQIGAEIQFLGLEFSLYRVILTFFAIIIIEFITEKCVSSN